MMPKLSLLVLAILFLVSAIISAIRWFIIAKDYRFSSFAVVLVQLIGFITLLTLSIIQLK